MEELELIRRSATKGIGIRAISGGFSGFGAAAVLITVKQPDPRGERSDKDSGAFLKQGVPLPGAVYWPSAEARGRSKKKADGALESAIG
jgi:hypothetical protein